MANTPVRVDQLQAQSPATVIALKSVLGVTSRINSGFFFLGDSRLAQESALRQHSPDNVVKNRFHFWHKANYQLGQAMKLIGTLAVSGLRSDQYLTQSNLNAAIASAAKNLMIYGAANDLGQGFTAAQMMAGYNGSPGINSAVAQAVAAGMRVILCVEAGADNFTSAMIGEMNKLRQYFYELNEANAMVELLDMGAPVWNGASTSSISFIAGTYQTDSGVKVHPGTLGAAYIAPNLVELAKRIGIAPVQRKIIAPWETGSNGSMQLLQNPLFTILTGGTADAGATGSVPASWEAGVTAGGLITGISGAPSSVGGGAELGCGNDVTLTVTAAASGDGGFFRQALNIAGLAGQYPAPAAGDIYQAGIEVSIASGSSNFVGAILYAGPNFTDSTFLQMEDGYATVNQLAGPTTAYTDTLETDKFTIPAGKTFLYWTFMVKWLFTGAGSATITFRQPQMRRRFS